MASYDGASTVYWALDLIYDLPIAPIIRPLYHLLINIPPHLYWALSGGAGEAGQAHRPDPLQADAHQAGPARCCSPRHRHAFRTLVSRITQHPMTWRVVSTRLYDEAQAHRARRRRRHVRNGKKKTRGSNVTINTVCTGVYAQRVHQCTGSLRCARVVGAGGCGLVWRRRWIGGGGGGVLLRLRLRSGRACDV